MAQTLLELERIHPRLGFTELGIGIRGVGAGMQELLQRPGGQKQVDWPIVPRPAPALAQAYQARDVTSELPAAGTVVLSGSSGYGKTQIAAAVFNASTADLRGGAQFSGSCHGWA